jgi:small-conductance mechanosensitive channel
VDRFVRGVGRWGDDGRAANRLQDLADRDRRRASDQEVSALDQKVDQWADALQRQADKAAANGGGNEKLAQMLADDAAFLRKLKPSLIKARAKGRAPTNQKPAPGTVAPSGPQLGDRPEPTRVRKSDQAGPNPFLVVGAAFVVGIFVAKWIDWRGHAHPR